MDGTYPVIRIDRFGDEDMFEVVIRILSPMWDLLLMAAGRGRSYDRFVLN